MNRRAFLAFSAAALAAPLAPVRGTAPWTPNVLRPSVSEVIGTPYGLVRSMLESQRALNEYYFFLHPRQLQHLRDMAARETWRVAYRTWRMSGRPGSADARAVLKASERSTTATNPLFKGDIRVWNGFQFHVSSGPPIRAAHRALLGNCC